MSGTVILHNAQRREWWRFDEPVEILEARRGEEVLACLRRIETLVNERDLYAAGFVAYDAAPAFDPALRVRAAADSPLLWFGLYRQPKVCAPVFGAQAQTLAWQPLIDNAGYARAVARIKDEIARGTTYQVNYTWRLRAPFSGDPWELFAALVAAQPVSYAAFVDAGRYVICSASPELFFDRRGDLVVAKPMKGTAPRGRFTVEDLRHADRLQLSVKDRAENVMIVDMVRNDLGRVARIGSVRVGRLWEVERYATLWQMTSTVTAETELPTVELLAALFPCASVTGAPKVSTMRLLAELETEPRGVYTGSVGFIAPGRRAQFNVAIRTVTVDRQRGQVEYGTGSGITWDSSADEEYAECMEKALVLRGPEPAFCLVETLCWTPTAGYVLLERHLERLRDSAAYFDFALDEERIRHALREAARAFAAPQRVRLQLAQGGEVHIDSSPLVRSRRGPVRLKLSPLPVDSRDRFLFHKTTRRDQYERALGACSETDDVLLWNERGEITETTIGNIVLRLDGELVTPPVECGLLPGTMRAELLARGRVRERRITLDRLGRYAELYRINSVRGCERAVLIGSEEHAFLTAPSW